MHSMAQLAQEIDEAVGAVTTLNVGDYIIDLDSFGDHCPLYSISLRQHVYGYILEYGPAQALWRYFDLNRGRDPFPIASVFEALFETWLRVRGRRRER